MPAPFHSSRGTRSCQRGAASVEFSLAALPLVMLGLGAIELANWMYVRQALSLALLEAARSAATSHARPDAIEAAFERALLPLHAGASPAESQRRLSGALARRSARLAGPPWQIEILTPTPASFLDFHQPALSRQFGHPAIDNTHQSARHRHHWEQRWPQGVGAASRMTIFEANTLHLRLTYPHEPLLPGVGALLRMLADGSAGYAQRVMASGAYMPMHREVAIVMQSHPVQWPAAANGKIRVAGPPGNSSTAPVDAPTSPCRGWWCPRPQPAPMAPVDTTGKPDTVIPRDANSLPVDGEEVSSDRPDAAPPAGSDPSLLAPDPQACGVAVCCVPD